MAGPTPIPASPPHAALLRPISGADVPDLLAVQNREETHWFGAPETDEAEFRDVLALADDLDRDTRLAQVAGAVASACWVWGNGDVQLVADPSQPASARAAAYDALLVWMRERGGRHVDALRQDGERLAALARHGWEPDGSTFELLRPSGAPPLPAANWPGSVTLTGLDLARHGRQAHQLLYERAGWTDVPGHQHRPFDQWVRLLAYDGRDPDEDLVAWAGSRPVGLATGSTFADGTGWVSYLAVDREWRGRGLGRALLVESLRRRISGGARQVGLGVSAQRAGPRPLHLRGPARRPRVGPAPSASSPSRSIVPLTSSRSARMCARHGRLRRCGYRDGYVGAGASRELAAGADVVRAVPGFG